MPEAGDCNKRSKSKGTDVSTSATAVDRNGDVLNSRRTVKMSDGSSTSSGDESPTETERRHQHKRSSLSRPSSKGQIHTSAFSVALSRSQMPAFPIPLTPMPMASASTSFNYHPPLAINSRTNSGRYSFESLTGNNENGNWRPGSGGQLPAANPLWYNAHQFGLNPYFSFGPYYGATPNYAEAMRQMMPAGGNMVGPNGFSESSSENSRAPSPRSRKRALSTSPGSDIMSLFNEIIRSTSNSLRPIGLHSDLNSRCSSSTSLGSFSHLSAGTISPSALYASPYQCRTPFFPPNMHNYGAKMPSVAATPGAPSAYPFPFMFPVPPFVKSDQTPNPSSGVQGSMPFPSFPGFPPPPPPNNNGPSTDSTPSPIKQETIKVSPVDKYCPPTKSDKSRTSSLSGHHRLTPTSIGDADKEHSNSMEDLPQTDCQWDTCTLQLEDQTKLVAHITNSHIKTQKEHICKWADCNRERKPFKAQYMLVVHMRHHTGEKPHKCSYENCTKAYGRLENLKTHLRSHTGDKPYRCEVQGCGKSFSNASDRAKHQNRTHSNEKPYACTLSGCTKRYTDPSSLRKHIKTVHGIEAYQNKRRKRLDSEQDNTNGDSVREHGLSSDVLRSKDNTDSRIDPNGSVQSSNVDSPGTYSNPTDEFCASVSPQANDSGVEMNIASDSMSCAMESLYSPELDAEIAEPLNALVAVNGDGEGDDEFFPMNLPNFRQRISLKPNLPTIPSGIPYVAERRVAEFVGGRQNIGLGCSIPQESVNCATVAACSSAGQHPSRAGNKFVKSPPIAKRRESTSSLASSIYSSIKSDLDATSYPAFSDCSRPESVMSSVSQTFERSRINNNQQQASLPYSYSTQPAIPRSPLLQNISPFTPNNNYTNCDLFDVGNNDLQLNTCRYQGGQTYCNDANGRHSVSNNGRQNESTFCAHSNGSSPWTSTQLSPNRAVSSSHQSNIPSDYCHQQQHQCQPYGSCLSSFGSPVNRTVNNDYSRVTYKEHHVGCLCNNNADTRRASTSTNDNNFCHRCSRVRVVNGRQNVDQNPRCVCARLNETNEDFRHRLRHEYLPSDSNRNVCPTSIRNNAVNYSSCRENWRSVDEDSRQQQIRRYDNVLVPSNRSPPISNVHQPQPFHQISRMVVRADVHGCDFQMNNSLRSNAVNRPPPPAPPPPPTTHLIETNDVQPADFDLSCLTFRNEPNVHPTSSLPAQIENTDDELYFERPPTVMERRMQAQSRTLYNSPNLLVNDMAMNLATFDVENRLYRSYMQSAQSNSQP